VLIAGFVTLVQMIVEAYAYPLHQSLGIFLPLIAVNCIIFSRAEVYAHKHPVVDSIIDALGMGIGFTLAFLVMASIREIFANGTWFGMALPVLSDYNIPLLNMAPGGFVVFALIIAVVNKLSKGRAIKKKEFGCGGCPQQATCGKGGAD
jgi:electron transport complex protein RnfE